MTTETPTYQDTAVADDGRVYVFCIEEPELRVTLPGRPHRRIKFLNGRVDNETQKLTEADLAYFERRMQEDMARGRPPKFIVWTGSLRDPNLRVLIENRVAAVIVNLATAQIGPNIMNTVAIRLAAMLSTPGQISGNDLTAETRSLLLSQIGKRPSSGLGHPNQRAEADARARIQGSIDRERMDQLEREQRLINEAAQRNMENTGDTEPGGEAPQGFPDTPDRELQGDFPRSALAQVTAESEPGAEPGVPTENPFGTN
jgi:hypothetical protein